MSDALKMLNRMGCCYRADNLELAAAGFRMWESFRRGRLLKYTGPCCKLFDDCHDRTAPPFHDHARAFIDLRTRELVQTIQPYIGRVADELDDRLDLPISQEWEDEVVADEVERRGHFRSMPMTVELLKPLVGLLERAQVVSQEWAGRYGLTARVSFDGWYSPQRVVLIEYQRERQGAA
jgi:hypothetical protein